MVIISKTILHSFGRKHPDSIGPLNDWAEKTEAADWSQSADIKNTFRSSDHVGNHRYVFDIKGNDYRLVAMIHFSTRTLYIRFLGTHGEYDDIDATSV